MKNSRLVASILLTILLCISLAFWALQLIRPEERPLAAPPQAKHDINLDAASGLFGGRSKGTAAPSNYQLRGVVYSSNSMESVAIIAANGKPAQAVAVGAEFLPGVTLEEVHPKYALISENGATQRLELPEKAPPSTSTASPAGSPAQPAQTPSTPAQQQSTPPPPKMMPPAAQTPATPGVTVQQPGQPAQNVPAQSVPAQNGSAGTGVQPAQPTQNVQPASVLTTRPGRMSTGASSQTTASM